MMQKGARRVDEDSPLVRSRLGSGISGTAGVGWLPSVSRCENSLPPLELEEQLPTG